jgi:hypothetical protein
MRAAPPERVEQIARAGFDAHRCARHRSITAFSSSNFGGFRSAVAGFVGDGAAGPAKQQPQALSTNPADWGLQAIDPPRS